MNPNAVIIKIFTFNRNLHHSQIMMSSTNGNIFRVTGHLCGEFTGPRWIPPSKGQWHGALMFSLICAWINDWVNNRKAGDLRRHRAHYDVSVMIIRLLDIWGIDSAFCGDLTVPSQRPYATPMNFWFLECAHMHVCWMIAGEASDIFWSSHTGYKNNIPNVIWMA